MVTIVDGKTVASRIKRNILNSLYRYEQRPVLGVFTVDPNEAIEKYILKKKQAAQEVGIDTQIYKYDKTIQTADFLKKMIEKIRDLDALIVQLPLPEHIDSQRVFKAIPEIVDVDVLNPFHFEAYKRGETAFEPPVAGAIREIIENYKISLSGRNVIVGAGKLVGRPTAALFDRLGVNYTVVTEQTDATTAKHLLKEADLIVSGVGKPNLIQPDDIKSGVVLIDAGTSGSKGVLLGDISSECQSKASVFAKTPGGVGPITVACLLRNTAEAFLSKHVGA